ncbi:membrane protein [Lederbergia galactosidilytica]|uniref:Membrane protein n=1 Tax=Lederbergia galactosidilytica TaxID=217031 RepID=A0A0Q9Y1K6_9BACI|nr:membrane protein [Lederbergia galactosidilytica]
MSFLLYLIIGGIIGWIASLILGRNIPGGIIGNIIAGIIGAWIGGALLGDWGPQVAGMAIVPALIGSLILVFIMSLILGELYLREETMPK